MDTEHRQMPSGHDTDEERANLAGIVLRPVYGIYAWSCFITCAFGALACTLVLPGTMRRRRWVTRCARLPFALAGIRTEVAGGHNLPADPCIVVANHASYLDGILLQAYLPPRFSYVIKGEVQKVPFVAFLLRRIGARFVDRHSAGASARDARTLVRAAGDGESLAFFPEGTFTPTPGLSAFRAGAFAAALRAGLPVVPVVIRGARRVLPAGRVLPRRGPVAIDILEPLPAGAAETSRELARLARERMLPALGEPDLAG